MHFFYLIKQLIKKNIERKQGHASAPIVLRYFSVHTHVWFVDSLVHQAQRHPIPHSAIYYSYYICVNRISKPYSKWHKGIPSLFKLVGSMWWRWWTYEEAGSSQFYPIFFPRGYNSSDGVREDGVFKCCNLLLYLVVLNTQRTKH